MTTGGYSTAMGFAALENNTTGHNNHAFGWRSLDSITTGAANVGVGSYTGQAQTTTSGGTYCGHYAGFGATGGHNNCIGHAAGYASGQPNQLSTGQYNILIGSYSDVAASSNTGSLVIGALVGKGTNTGYIVGSSGVYNAANNSSWSTTSDRRLKKNIVDSPIGLAEINQIKVRNFEYKTKDDLSEIESDGLCENDIIDTSGVQVGAIAQEIQAVLPKCVHEESTGVLGVNADNLTWHLVKAVQELKEEIDELKKK